MRNLPHTVIDTIKIQMTKNTIVEVALNTLNQKVNDFCKANPGAVPMGNPYPAGHSLCRDVLWQEYIATDEEAAELRGDN